jgi:iron(II)-dependent oxidoreductase
MTVAPPAHRLAVVAQQLVEARERTLDLIGPVSDEDLVRQHDPLMGPLLWDLGHIAHFEDLWLTRNLDGPIEFAEMPGMYNPFEHPRRVRGALPYPSRDECLAMMAEIRTRVLARLERIDSAELDHPLLQDGYVYDMVLQHECQHNETMLQTLQLKQGAPYRPVTRWEVPAAGGTLAPRRIEVRGGLYSVGTDDVAGTYDNERPHRLVRLAPFGIDAWPVTNAQYQGFMEDGGYRRGELWSAAGAAWLAEAGVEAPKHWVRVDGTWQVRRMDRSGPVPLDHPVCHVCYYEAEAFAAWAGGRLPTEWEWEVAASWDPAAGRARRFPWGDAPADRHLANVDQLSFGTAPVGAYPANHSPLGGAGMIGDVWEWTASDFAGYPEFVAFPYREYSEVFFGPEYKVLRGGSWATRPAAIRNTFRNWDYPIRRQIFSGFRCAYD